MPDAVIKAGGLAKRFAPITTVAGIDVSGARGSVTGLLFGRPEDAARLRDGAGRPSSGRASMTREVFAAEDAESAEGLREGGRANERSSTGE